MLNLEFNSLITNYLNFYFYETKQNFSVRNDIFYISIE